MDTNAENEQPGGADDEYVDQDAEPTMTAPDGARPDGKTDEVLADSASGSSGSMSGSGSGSGSSSGGGPTDIEQEIGDGGGGQ